MAETNLNKFTINYLTEEQYNNALAAGTLNDNDFYCTTSNNEDLKNEILVEDSLQSTSTENALSANQGRVLNDKIEVTKEFLLWRNPDPNIAMESQIIDLSTDDYDIYEVYFKETPTGSVLFSISGVAEYSVLLHTVNGWDNKCASRGIYKQPDKSKLKIEVAYYGGNTTADNNYCIPVYIIGRKTDIFKRPVANFTYYTNYLKTESKTFEFEEGMTWKEFIDSDYNTDSYFSLADTSSSTSFIKPNGNEGSRANVTKVLESGGESYIYANTTIIADAKYHYSTDTV